MPLVAGVDSSTQATKVVIVDADSGSVIAGGRSPHTVEGTGGVRQTDPEHWWRALESALEQTQRAAEVDAISVAGQQHGLVILDPAGKPLTPAPLWNDTTSADDAAALCDTFGPQWWASEVGLVPVASFTASKWAHLKRTNPRLARQVAAIRLPHDFLTERLTGRGLTDRSDASGTAWWSASRAGYVDEVLTHPLIEIDETLLPHVVEDTGPAGAVTTPIGGLRPGVAVAAGAGDNAAAALGLGLDTGAPVISLGTSGTAYLRSATPAHDPSGTVAGFADATGGFLPLAATLNCTLAVDRVAAWLHLDREQAADATGVTVLPYLDGERTPNLPDATGTITGLRQDTTPEEILLAAYEGATLSLLEALDSIEEHSSGIDPGAPLVLVGGGAAGPTWQRVIRRLSGRSLRIPTSGEHVALGAAAQAAAALSGEDPVAVARSWRTQEGHQLDPLPRDVDTIDRLRALRATIHP